MHLRNIKQIITEFSYKSYALVFSVMGLHKQCIGGRDRDTRSVSWQYNLTEKYCFMKNVDRIDNMITDNIFVYVSYITAWAEWSRDMAGLTVYIQP